MTYTNTIEVLYIALHALHAIAIYTYVRTWAARSARIFEKLLKKTCSSLGPNIGLQCLQEVQFFNVIPNNLSIILLQC